MAETKQPAGAGDAAPLTPDEVVDKRDISPRAAAPVLTGKRVRAIPRLGGTVVEVRESDFAYYGVDHPDVRFVDTRFFNLNVDENGLSEEAAKFLTEKFPETFEFVDEG